MKYEGIVDRYFERRTPPVRRGRYRRIIDDYFIHYEEPTIEPEPREERLERIQVPGAPARLQVVGGEEEGWLKGALRAIGGGFFAVGRGLAGAAKATLEAVPGGQDLYHTIKRAQEKWEEDESWLALPGIGLREGEEFYAPRVGEDVAKRYGKAAISSIVQSSIATLAGILTKKPLVGLAAFGITALGQKYLQMRDAGESIPTSLAGSGVVGASEALTELPAYKALTNPLTKSILRRAFNTLLPQMAGEQVNTIVESAVDKVTIRPDMTFQDYLSDAFDTAILTILQTGGQTAIMHPIVRHEANRMKGEAVDKLRDREAPVVERQKSAETLASLMENREEGVRWYNETVSALKAGQRQVRIPDEFQEAKPRFIEADANAFRRTLDEVLLQLRAETPTQRLRKDLAAEAIKEGDLQKASEHIQAVAEELPEEEREKIKPEQIYTQNLSEEMVKIDDELEARKEEVRAVEAEVQQRIEDVVDLYMERERFARGPQGELILERLPEREVEPPIAEEPVPPEVDERQLEMLNEIGMVREDLIQKAKERVEGVKVAVTEKVGDDTLQKVGAIVDEIKGYEPGTSVKLGRTVEGVLRDAVINPISAALGLRELGKVRQANEAAERAVEMANRIKEAVPELTEDVDRLMRQLTDAVVVEPMAVQELKQQPEAPEEVVSPEEEELESPVIETEAVERVRKPYTDIWYKETQRISKAKTIKGFIADVVKAFDDVVGEKGFGRDELTAINNQIDGRTVKEILLAGETVSWNTKELGYDLDPIDGHIYVYVMDMPDEETVKFKEKKGETDEYGIPEKVYGESPEKLLKAAQSITEVYAGTSKDTDKIRKREAEALKKYAEENGYLIPHEPFTKKWQEESDKLGGKEHQIVATKRNTFIKRKSYFHYDETYHDYLERLRLHNIISPVAPYRLLGFSVVYQHGEEILMPVVEQPFILGRPSTQDEIDDHMDKMGFIKRGNEFYGEAGGLNILVGDAFPFNAITTEGGVVLVDLTTYAIEPSPQLKELIEIKMLEREGRVKPLPEPPAGETFQERADRITREAQALGIHRKGKTLEQIEEEIRAKREQIEAEEVKAEKKHKPLPKKLLLHQLKKLIGNIYTNEKGHTKEDRERLYNKMEKMSPEELRRAMDNMKRNWEEEKEEDAEFERAGWVEKRRKREELEDEEGEVGYQAQDLSGVSGEELSKALYNNAYYQLRLNPISFSEWSKHIEDNFPTIKEAERRKMWDDATKRLIREENNKVSEVLENSVENTVKEVEDAFVEPTEFTREREKIKNEEREKAGVEKPKSILEILSNHAITGRNVAIEIANTVRRASDLVYYLQRSVVPTFRAYGDALAASPKIMEVLEDTDVVSDTMTEKPSMAITKWVEDEETGKPKLEKTIKLNSHEGTSRIGLETDMVHEIDHILTMPKITQSKRLRDALRDLVDVLEATLTQRQKRMLRWMRQRKNFGKVHPNAEPSEAPVLYALTNEHELSASMSSSFAFQAYATRVKYVPKEGKFGFVSSVWNRYISIIRQFSWDGKVNESVLDEGLRLVAAIREMPPILSEGAHAQAMTKDERRARVESALDTLSAFAGATKRLWRKVGQTVRVPVWNKAFKPLVDKLYEADREAHRISFTASQMVKFLKEGDVSPALQRAIIESDAQGKIVGRDELSPPDRVKFDAIRAALDYIIRDQMGKFYIEDAVYKKQKELKRSLNAEEVNEIRRDSKAFIEEHYVEGYFPRFRLGNQALVVKDRDGKTIFFGTFDSSRERDRVLDNFIEAFGDVQYEAFDMRDRYKDIEGVFFALQNAHILENMLKEHGATSEELKRLASIVGTEFLKKWAGGRLAHRKEALVPGYETNVVRALHRYIETFPRAMTRKFLTAQIEDLVKALPEKEWQYGRDLVDYFMGKIMKEGKVNVVIRTIIFNAYFMLKPAFAIVNLSQRVITTTPLALEQSENGLRHALEGQKQELSFYNHQMKEWKSLYEALNTFEELSYGDRMIMRRLVASGDVAPMRTHEIVEDLKIGRAFAFFANISEKSNRLMAAFTGLRIGHEKGLSGVELETYVREFVNGTQWLYNKANRAKIARGILAPVMMFKSFVLNDLHFLRAIYPNKKVFGTAVAVRLSLGGVGGIYGASAFMSLLNIIMSGILGDDDWYLSVKEFKDKFPRALTEGLPSLIGISGSSMFGASELFGTAIMPYAKAAYDIVREYERLGEVRPETWRRILPSQAKHLWRINLKKRFQDEDIERLPREIRKRVRYLWEKTPKEARTFEKMIGLLGFATETPAQFYEAIHAIKRTGMAMRARKSRLAKRLADALYEKDYEKAREIREEARRRGFILSPTSIRRFKRRRRYAEGGN